MDGKRSVNVEDRRGQQLSEWQKEINRIRAIFGLDGPLEFQNPITMLTNAMAQRARAQGLARAKAWYTAKMGFTPSDEFIRALTYRNEITDPHPRMNHSPASEEYPAENLWPDQVGLPNGMFAVPNESAIATHTGPTKRPRRSQRKK